ncbi:MAG TPA: FAD-dependent monooxygenase [Pseudonocardia sp.]|jgi:2-polyprenyl-6-methoxyphenol hydroxylase-like FAD-dependent oxidoreductase
MTDQTSATTAAPAGASSTDAGAGDGPDTVLVVGAGPVGLLAAAEIVRQGGRARVVETLTQPTSQSRAAVVHARTQEHLAALGVLGEIETRALAQTALEIHAGRAATTRVRITTDTLDSRYRRSLDLPQSDTEAVLGKRVEELGIDVERGVTVTGLTQTPEAVEVSLTTPTGTQHCHVGWVIGADGGHSTVRSAVGTQIDGVFEGQNFILADVATASDLSQDTIRVFAHPDGMCVAMPMRGGRTRFIFLVDKPPAGSEPTHEQCQRIVDERMGGRWSLGEAFWLTYFEVHHGQVPRYRFDRVLLAGDAAHIHSPAGGQGMNTGLQDAANLAWKLALVSTGRAHPDLLDSYHEERHPVAAAVVRQTTILTDVMAGSGTADMLRDLALFLLGHAHALGEKAMAGFAETGIGYPDSPIVARRGGHGHRVRPAGSHAPDPAGLRTPAGDEVWIGDLLRRPGHLLLAAGAGPELVERLRGVLGGIGTVVAVVRTADGAPTDALVDVGGLVTGRYGIGERGIALIRPDGYLGYLSTTADEPELTAYLAGALHVTAASPTG